MEMQWVLLAVSTVVMLVAMFCIGYWLEGRSSIDYQRRDEGSDSAERSLEFGEREL